MSDLVRLVVVYRGVMLYGASGAGKSSLINAGLIAAARRKGFQPERVRVQPRAEQEFVVERIALDDEGNAFLPSLFAGEDDAARQIVLSTQAFEEHLRAGCTSSRPLLVFDQFEELVTLFEDAGKRDLQHEIVDLLIGLLRDEVLPVKLLFAFREDYLARVKQLLGLVPELFNQALRLSPPAAEALTTIIRGPFERYPGQFGRELTPELALALRDKLAYRFGSGEVSLSEVQTVCLRLWHSDDPEALLEATGVQGLLEDYLGEELEAFPPDLRYPAVALLSQMVTSSGTRNVISADDLIGRVRDENERISPELLEEALERLESASKLVRRERRRELYLYEITSEFLVPWISRRREEFVRLHDRRRERRRAGLLAAAALLAVGIALALIVLTLKARDAQHLAQSRELAARANAQLDLDPHASLALAVDATKAARTVQAEDSLRSALAGSFLHGVLRGHKGSINVVHFSPDGTLVVSGSDDGTARVWHVGGGRVLVLRADRDAVTAAVFSPDGKLVLTAGTEGTARLWRTADGSELRVFRQGASIQDAAFSPNGRLVVTAGDDGWRLWRVSGRTAGTALARVGESGDTVQRVAFSSDGKFLMVGGAQGSSTLWRVPSGTKVTELSELSYGADGAVLAFSRDGRLALTASGKTANVSEVPSGKPLAELGGFTGAIADAAFSPDSSLVATTSTYGGVRLWSTAGESIAVLQDERKSGLYGQERGFGSAGRTEFSPDGTLLVAPSPDGSVRLWRVPRGQLVALLPGHSGPVTTVAFSPRGDLVATGSEDRTVRLWRTWLLRRVATFSADREPLYTAAFSPDGRLLATGGDDRAAHLWRLGDASLVATLRPKSRETVEAVAFDPTGMIFATGSIQGEIDFWRGIPPTRAGKAARVGGFLEGIAFSPDGQLLVGAYGAQRAFVWTVPRGRIVATLGGHTGEVFRAAFSPDGNGHVPSSGVRG